MNYWEKTVKEGLDAWLEEFIPGNIAWVRERRIEYLERRRPEIFREMLDLFETYMQFGWHRFLQMRHFSKLFAELKRNDAEIDLYRHPRYTGSNMEQMIESARNYPIDQLIEVNAQGFAVCPFHTDSHPSAFTRKNYLYCFVCNESADTIKLYMHLHNVSFKEAVKSLN